MKVKPLHLDFYKKAKPFPWLGAALLAIGGLALVWQAHREESIDVRKELVDQRAEKLSARAWELDPQGRAGPAEPGTEEVVAALIQKQQEAPTVGLRLLEKTWSSEIAYLRVDVETLERSVKVEFEAKHRENILALVDTISKEPQVDRVTLVRQTAKITDPFLPTQAQVEFWWKETP
ncbi:hypothetical protein [Variovorax rhizosphaerae]|uniref:Uncharacterized protein n=1 Tax=Variovorax rhizosphaerae TaxID=1836200 RepID=A0ABU8WVV8_9BURK